MIPLMKYPVFGLEQKRSDLQVDGHGLMAKIGVTRTGQTQVSRVGTQIKNVWFLDLYTTHSKEHGQQKIVRPRTPSSVSTSLMRC